MSMSEDGKVIYKIEGDDSQALKAVEHFERAAKDSGKDVESAAKKSSKNVEDAVEKTTQKMESDIVASAKKIAKAIGSAFTVKKIVEFGAAAVNVASDLSEVQNVVDTTFGTEGAIRVNEWAKNAAEAFGESELQAKQFTSTLGAMFKSMGVGQAEMEDMSLSLAGLAGDMASFYNLDPTEAFEKLRSGISGETEPLKQLGINMSVANLEAHALSQGINKAYSEMTQAEQATLRYNYIMTATADAQGDFSKTSDSFANQQRILKLEIQELAAEIGQDLMPAAMEVVAFARDGIEWIRENKDALEALAGAVGLAATGYATWRGLLKMEDLYDQALSGIKSMAAALSGAEAAGGLTGTLKGAGSAAASMGTTILGALGPGGWAVVAAVAGLGLIVAAVVELQRAEEEALQKQFEYIDSLTTLADYQANGLVDAGGRVDYKRAEKMQADGTFKKADKVLGPSPGRKTYTIGQLASRHQSGEDFVMADWTPAYLDYGERVLTASENARYTAMGGVDGMERAAAAPVSGGFSGPSKMELGLKVSPREMAHAITPYIIRELQAQGQWEDVR